MNGPAQWASHVFLEYDRLTGNVANSPLVVQRGSPDQLATGVGITYSFETSPIFVKAMTHIPSGVMGLLAWA